MPFSEYAKIIIIINNPFLKIALSFFSEKKKLLVISEISVILRLCQCAITTSFAWVYKQFVNRLCNREPGQIFSALKYQ